MTRHLKPIVALCVIALGACADLSKPDEFGNIYDTENFGASYSRSYPEAGYTYATSNRLQGIQIAYVSEDNRTYIWYPTSYRPLTGTWRRDSNNVCLEYDLTSLDPSGIEQFPTLEERCAPTHEWGRVISRSEGDIFNLKGGTLPDFDLTQCRLPSSMTLITSSWSCEPRLNIREQIEAVDPSVSFVAIMLASSAQAMRLYDKYYECVAQQAEIMTEISVNPRADAQELVRACDSLGTATQEEVLSLFKDKENERAQFFARKSDMLEQVLALHAIQQRHSHAPSD